MRRQSSPSSRTRGDGTRRDLLERAARVLLIASLLVNVAALARFWMTWETMPLFAGNDGSVPVAAGVSPTVSPTTLATTTPVPTFTTAGAPTQTPLPTLSPTPRIPRVGLIAGHWQNDSGAICEEDGLQEVEITVSVARETAKLLRERGYAVDVLAEYDPQLYRYEADALVSIHADSCLELEGATGFKVARATASAIPAIEDRLVACLYDQYGRATNLPRHETSITHNMTSYHAFYKIDPKTPAVIIEVGFLYNDRDLLTDEPDVVATGIANGIECFLAEG